MEALDCCRCDVSSLYALHKHMTMRTYTTQVRGSEALGLIPSDEETKAQKGVVIYQSHTACQ